VYVHADDVAPPSLLRGRPLGRGATLAGLLLALGTHLVLPLVVILIFAAAGALGGDDAAERAPLEDREIVVAHFVEKGVHFDPRRLPNRRVNRLTTAPPPDSVAVSKNLDPPPPTERPDMGPRPENAQVAELLHLGDRAQMFAELAAQAEREGEPEGVEGGFDSAREGDVYLGQFVMFFRRGWTTPTTIDPETLQGLSVTLDVAITEDGHIASTSVTRGSGDALFDQSALDRIEALRSADATIPEPPETVRGDYFGRTRSVRFNGRDAR
jgi:TonB family protein